MSNINSPVITDIRYHFAWHTKFKEPILTGDVRVRARNLIAETCGDIGIKILNGHVGKNHVYMQLSCPARIAPAEIVRRLKGRSSRVLRQEYPQIKLVQSDCALQSGKFGRNLEGSFWDEGYFCATFGDVAEEAIRQYLDGVETCSRSL